MLPFLTTAAGAAPRLGWRTMLAVAAAGWGAGCGTGTGRLFSQPVPAAVVPVPVASLPVSRASAAGAPPSPATYDSVAAGSILVNSRPLGLWRRALRRELGAADSTATFYGEEAVQLPAGPDSALTFERYRGSFYYRRGAWLDLLETSCGQPLRVQLGGQQLDEHTTAAEVRALFPASYRHRVALPGGFQLLLYPTRPGAASCYVLALRGGRLVQFRQSFAVDYD